MEDHLPVLGVGPLYVLIIAAATIGSLILDALDLIPSAEPIPMSVCYAIAAVLIVLGICMWYVSVIRNRISEKIENNQLATDGIYAWVRNPIYSSFMFIAWGLLFVSGNVYLLILAPTYWILMTVMMVRTEEVWLRGRYGKEYDDYCSRVNRCIPWFPKK